MIVRRKGRRWTRPTFRGVNIQAAIDAARWSEPQGSIGLWREDSGDLYEYVEAYPYRRAWSIGGALSLEKWTTPEGKILGVEIL